MSKEYTLGPFDLIEQTDPDDYCWDIMQHPDEHSWIYVGEAYKKADAVLWSSATDMLEALRKIVNNWGNLHPKDRQQAKAAIAKAIGEEA